MRDVFRRTAGDDMEVDAYSLRVVLDEQFKSGTVTPSALLPSLCQTSVSVVGDTLVTCVWTDHVSEMKLRPRFRFDGFSLETCRSLVAMMDVSELSL